MARGQERKFVDVEELHMNVDTMLPTLLAALLVFSSSSLAAELPSFDCSKADSAAEDLVCADADLAGRDRKLAEIYRQSLERLDSGGDSSGAVGELRAEQRGWIGGRNDCWKADDPRECVQSSYRTRIAELEATYDLAPHLDPVSYVCEGNPANEIVATFYQTELPTVKLERGDSRLIGIQGVSASGARYLAPFGVAFWVKGEDAMVEWPEGTSFGCRTRS